MRYREQGEDRAVPVRRYGTHNAGMINFRGPLQKLNRTVPADRQFIVTPYPKEISRVTAFVFPLNQPISVPRKLKNESHP